MKILITGASGFLGKALSDKLEELGNSVIRYSSKTLNLCGEIELPKCDVLFHIGGNSKVYLAKQNPRFDFEVNAHGTIKLLEASVKAGIPKIVYTSSNSVYKDLTVKDENASLGNNSYGKFYGLSKLTADL
ncbi:SDR family oxidoreductase, partial [bacterium]|nr:SDR family oxidoreductase [bacterium]